MLKRRIPGAVLARMRRGAIWGATLLLALALSASASAVTRDGFCGAPSKNRLLREIERLPALHSPPGGPIPASGAIELHVADQIIVPVGRKVGFFLPEWRGYPRRPAWEVEAVFAELRPSGRVRRIVETVSTRLPRRRQLSLTYRTPRAPHLYRVDIYLSAKGKRVAHYAQYFRSGRPRHEGLLGVSARQFRPGETLFARFDNVGTQVVYAGYGGTFERFDGVEWVLDPTLQRGETYPLVSVGVPPGAVFDCFALPIPADQPPGLYRFKKREGSRPAEFEVLPSS